MSDTHPTEHSPNNSPPGSPEQSYLTIFPSDSTSSAGIALNYTANLQVDRIVDPNSYIDAHLISGQTKSDKKIRVPKYGLSEQCSIILIREIKIEILPLQQYLNRLLIPQLQPLGVVFPITVIIRLLARKSDTGIGRLM